MRLPFPAGHAMRFDADFLKTLEHLRFASTRVTAGAGRGERRSRHRGRGIEFADYRPYAQGDDFRHIDWKAYKRLGRLFLRLFDEDQDLSVHIFLDTSRSMATCGKFDHAVRLAAALGYLGAVRFDRVSIHPFADRLGVVTATGHGRHSIARLLTSLTTLAPDGRTDLSRAVRDFAERSHRQGLAIVISDMLDPGGCERAVKLLASRGHDVAAIHVVASGDRADVPDSDDGVVVLTDVETGEERRIELTPGLVSAHRRAWEAFDRTIADACRRSGAQYLQTNPELPLERVILETLRTGRLLE